MHDSKLLAAIYLACVIGGTILFSPMVGGFVIGGGAILAAIWGMIFEKEITIRLFGNKVRFTGLTYMIYMGIVILAGVAMIFYSLHKG